jgi:hypothetical protein
MSAPKYAESIPAVTAPVKLPRLVKRRASFLANVISGGVLIMIDVAGIVYYFVSGAAS